MSLRSRITGLALASIGSAALLGSGSGTAHASSDLPCDWNEEKKDFNPPSDPNGQCTKETYTWGKHEGFVGTRGAILKDGKPIWAEYPPDQTIQVAGRDVLIPGVPEVIAEAAGKDAVVVGREEAAQALAAFNALDVRYQGKYEIVRRPDFLTYPRHDKNGDPVAMSRSFNARSQVVMALMATFTEPGKDPFLGEFPLDPREIVGQTPRANYLVQTSDGLAGHVIRASKSFPKGEGTITYLSAFFSETQGSTRFGFCKDYNGGPDHTGSLETDRQWGLPARDDRAAFAACDAWRIGTMWGPIRGAWVDSGSRWMFQGHGTPTVQNGGYELEYPYPAKSLFYDTMFVTLNYQPLDPRSRFASRFTIRKQVVGGATLEFNQGAFEAFQTVATMGLASGGMLLSAANPFLDNISIDTHKPRSVNFGVEVSFMEGFLGFINPARPGIPWTLPAGSSGVINVNENDEEGADGRLHAKPPHYSTCNLEEGPCKPYQAQPSGPRQQVQVDAATGQVVTGGAGGAAPTGGSSGFPGLGGAAGVTPEQLLVRRVQYGGAGGGGGTAGTSPNPKPTPDGTPNPVYDDGLLVDIGRSDFANTDIHVFGPTGDLVSSRIGLRQNESPGMVCSTPPIDEPTARPHCEIPIANANPLAIVPFSDFIRNRYPGARYKVVVVNRSTGYMGTGSVKIQEAGTRNGLDSFEIEGSQGSQGIRLEPPNLKVEVKRLPSQDRVDNDLCRSLAPGEECEQVVGFEGGGLSDDVIMVTTEWLDADGSPLPGDLPGFTARLSRVVGGMLHSTTSNQGLVDPNNNQGFGKDGDFQAGDLSHFQIRPNKHLQIVRMPNKSGEAYHYYLHVSGANADRCGKASSESAPLRETWEWFTDDSPACASFAREIDNEFKNATDRRPARYVPIKVPVFDAATTAERLDQQIQSAREAAIASGSSQPVMLPTVKPIYTYVYRPEAQFSLYDLPEFQSPQVITKYDSTTGQTRTSLSFGYELSNTEGENPLSPLGSPKDPTWSLGFDELLAIVGGAHTASWENLESLTDLSPADQAALTGQLSPSNFLALQLYLANDRGNPLYQDIDIPYLLKMDAAPIALTRRETLGSFSVDATVPPFLEGYRSIPFTLLADADVRITAINPAGDSVQLMATQSVLAGPHYYVLDGSQVSTLAIDNDFTLHFEATPKKINGREVTQFGTHVVDIQVQRNSVRSNRAFGEVVEHDVNLLDGSLRLSRQDFSLPGFGPELSLERGYSNLLGGPDALLTEDGEGDLGRGWSHNLNLHLSVLAPGQIGTESIPAWVSQATVKGICDPAFVEGHLAEEAQGIGAVSVNGAMFMKINGAWIGERGRQAQLYEDNGCSATAPADCFQYIARDGTRYFYDYPMPTPPTEGTSAAPGPTLLDPSGLSSRLGKFTVAGAPATSGAPGASLPSAAVNRIVDRFGNRMQFHYRPGADGRLDSVEDASHRTCTFNYEPSILQGCEGEQSPAFRRLRSVTCLAGHPDVALTINYCYDDRGNLARVSRDGGKEQENYTYQYKGGLKGAGENLSTVSDARGSTHTYHYVPGRGVIPSGIDPTLKLHKEDMIESIEMPPTEGIDGPLQPVVQFWYGPNRCNGATCTPDNTRTVTDPRGRGLKKVYRLNQRGNPVRIDEPKGKYTELVWSEDSKPGAGCGDGAPSFGHALMQRSVFRGDKVIVTNFGYDELGNITSECGPGGYTQTWYHPSATGGDPSFEKLLPRSGFGLIASHTDFHNVTQEWHYDEQGFLQEHVSDVGHGNFKVQYTQDPDHPGRVKQETVLASEGNRVTTYEYDTQGNLKSSKIEGIGGSLSQTHYDLRGRLQSATDRRGATTTYHYDVDDRLKVLELPTGVTTAGVDHIATTLIYDYDAAGNLTYETDRNGLVYTYAYTLQNQVKKVTRAADVEGSASRLIKYDELGNVRSSEDWAGKAFVYTYDDLGFRETTLDRLGEHTATTVHDLVGNVTKSIDFAQLETHYTYDDLNRELTTEPKCGDPDCVVQQTDYDLSPTPEEKARGARYVASMTEAGRTYRTGYDARSDQVVTTNPKGDHKRFEYDELGRLRKTTNEAAFVTKYDYDLRGYLTQATVVGTEDRRHIRTQYVPDENGNQHFVYRWRDADDESTKSTIRTEFDDWNRPTTRSFSGPGVPTVNESYVYDGSGNLVEHTDTGGRGRLWHRDARGQLRKYENAEGETREYELFDPNGNATRVRDARQVETSFTYDDEERLLTMSEASNHPGEGRSMIVRERDGLGNPLRVSDFRNHDRVYTYSARHRLKTEADPGKPAVQYFYTPSGQIDYIINERGFTRRFAYDALDRVQDTFYPTKTLFESHTDYDAVGNVTKQRNIRGSVVETIPDDLLRPHFVDRYLEGGGRKVRAVTREYDDLGNVISQTDAGNGDFSGVTVRYAYNNHSQLERTVYAAVAGEDELARSEVRTYNLSGTLRSVTLPHESDESAYTTTYGYDREDRLLSMEAAGQATSYKYDPNGNVTAVIKPENQDGTQPTPNGGTFAAGKFPGKFRNFKYDYLNRLSQVTDEVGLSMKYLYDSASNMQDVYGPYLGDVWDGSPHVHYDIDPIINRVTERTQYQALKPSSVTTFAEYDAHDNVKTLIDPLRRTFHYNYDHYDRLRLAEYQDDPATPFFRPQKVDVDIDDVANKTTTTETKLDDNNNPVVDTTVDELDLVFDRLAKSTQRGIDVIYDYYDNGSRRSVSAAKNGIAIGSTSYRYDARNRLHETTVNGDLTTYEYHQDGRIKVTDLGNGTGTTYAYAPDHRVSDITHQFALTNRHLHYEYDKNGNTTLSTDTTTGSPPDVTTFDKYDAADRLVQFTQDHNTTTFTYERYNRIKEVVVGPNPANKAFQYDPLSERIKQVTDTVANTTITFDDDANGNVTRRETQPANTVDKLEYDVLNKLKRITRGPPLDQPPQEVLGSYDYDFAGRRVRQADTDRGRVETTYDGIQVLREANDGDPGFRVYNHYDGASLLAQTKNGFDRYYHQDSLGSTFDQSDEAATSLGDFKYDPFGRIRTEPAFTPSGTKFTGQQHDERTGLDYYGARYYDPTLGRFLSEDTLEGSRGKPESFQKYLYARSNPAKFVDPTGHQEAPAQGGGQGEQISKAEWCRRNPQWCTTPDYPDPDPIQTPGAPTQYTIPEDGPITGEGETPRQKPVIIEAKATHKKWSPPPPTPPSKERAGQVTTAESDAGRRAAEIAKKPADAPPAPTSSPGFWSTAWSGIKSGDIGPSSAFGQMVAHGDFGFEVFGHKFEVSKTLQDDKALEHAQNAVLAATAGAELMILSGGSAGLLEGTFWGGAYGQAVIGGVAYGIGDRGVGTGLEGGDVEQILGSAFDPMSMATDAALALAFTKGFQVIAPVAGRVAGAVGSGVRRAAGAVGAGVRRVGARAGAYMSELAGAYERAAAREAYREFAFANGSKFAGNLQAAFDEMAEMAAVRSGGVDAAEGLLARELSAEEAAIREVGAREAGAAANPKHHIFPQEDRAFFEARGFTGERSIDRFTLELEEATHQAIHGGGDWRLGRTWEGEWNRQMMTRIVAAERAAGRRLAFGEVMKIGGQMTREYGLGGIKWIPYR